MDDPKPLGKDLEFEKYVMGVVNEYVPKLLLQRNTWELKYGCENAKATMECKFNYPYLNVTLHYGDKVIKDWKDGKDVVPYIVHEMCHPITDPLYCKATNRWSTHDEVMDERELLTDYICNIVIKK